MLLFKKQYLDLIRSGQKRLTIRLWPYRRMKPGQRSYIPGIGHITIESVEPIALDELTEDDATQDGFCGLQALRDELATIYAGEQTPRHKAFRVRFELIPPPGENPQRTTPTTGEIDKGAV